MGIILVILLFFASPALATPAVTTPTWPPFPSATSSSPLPSADAPLGLLWDRDLADIPQEIAEFKYWYGDLEWGIATYLGISDFVGLATELVLEFAKNRLARATLILHDGLNEANCIVKYKEINELLTRKYGPHRSMASIRDPLLDDMIYYRECYSLRSGMQEHETTWMWKGFKITSVVFGDEDTIFIEIEYTRVALKEALTDQEIQKLLKRL